MRRVAQIGGHLGHEETLADAAEAGHPENAGLRRLDGGLYLLDVVLAADEVAGIGLNLHLEVRQSVGRPGLPDPKLEQVAERRESVKPLTEGQLTPSTA